MPDLNRGISKAALANPDFARVRFVEGESYTIRAFPSVQGGLIRNIADFDIAKRAVLVGGCERGVHDLRDGLKSRFNKFAACYVV